MERKGISKNLKFVIQGAPLLGAVVASLLPISGLSHQLIILIVLLWIQVFFIFECFRVNR